MPSKSASRDRRRPASIAKHLLIHGSVQGVGFRESLRYKAEMRGLTGWVRNRREGTVEAVVAGDPSEVAEIVAWARRGPSSSHVTRVDVKDVEWHFTAFERWPTV